MFGPAPVPHLSLPHLVRPPDEDGGGAPPLIALLHGYGSNEADLFSFADLLAPAAVVVSPRATRTLGAGSYAWLDIDFAAGGALDAERDQMRVARDRVARFVAEAVRDYHADPRRVFVVGFSQGATVALMVGLSDPSLVAGIAAMSGWLPLDLRAWLAPEAALAGLPVLQTHGTRDDTVPIALGRETRDLLASLPVALDYREFDARHEVSERNLEDLIGWLNARIAGGD